MWGVEKKQYFLSSGAVTFHSDEREVIAAERTQGATEGEDSDHVMQELLIYKGISLSLQYAWKGREPQEHRSITLNNGIESHVPALFGPQRTKKKGFFWLWNPEI